MSKKSFAISVTKCADCPFMYESYEVNRCGDTYDEKCCILIEDHTTSTGVPYEEYWGDEFDRDSENLDEAYSGNLSNESIVHPSCPLRNRTAQIHIEGERQ